MTDTAVRMDRMYRFQRHIYDITRRPYLLGRLTLVNGLCPPPGGTVLEFGCGTAWNLVETAKVYPEARLFGFDVSTVMLETARKRVAGANFQSRTQLAPADATGFNARQLFGVAAFDRVVLSYTLSMIPPWRHVLSTALAHVAPAGQLHIVDFGDAMGLPTIARTGLHAWLAQFDVTPRETLKDELSHLSQQNGCALFHADLYRGYAQYAVLKRA